MPIDLTLVATTAVTTFLVPYAKAGIEKIATAVTEKVGEKAAEYAGELTGKIWVLVKSAFSSPKEQATVELFEENPDEMQAMMIKALQEKLAQDPTLAQQLAELMNQPGPDGASTGAKIMQAGIAGIADLRGANLSHAQGMDISGVKIGHAAPPTTSDKPVKKA
ncbi:MAG: hypothetical protein JW953_00640 [Anaerolineae bacterium]|nr:hypothetical protein [Anaerolineae bacterium]